MKMGLANICGFFSSVLSLILLVDSTVACDPTPDEYKMSYCSFSYVFRGRFKNSDKEDMPLYFEISQVIRGPSDMNVRVKINRKSLQDCKYNSAALHGTEFVIAGFKPKDEEIKSIACDESGSWDTFSCYRKEYLNNFSKNCF